DPSDSAWFFNAGTGRPVANLAGPVGAFLAELSFQLVGYAAYVFPLVAAAVGWFRFWCTPIDAIYTKLTGLLLLFSSAGSRHRALV
ncbi:MAG: DNA translocase FtsK 4TM domain-containing protein, partial [Acidobacteriota bacterium]